MLLKDQHCEKCTSETPPVTDQELAGLIKEVPEWQPVMRNEEARLRRQFRFGNFREALNFTNQVGELAEAEDHHPEITLGWGFVRIDWWTHSIGGLHHNDFVCAARTDELAGDSQEDE